MERRGGAHTIVAAVRGLASDAPSVGSRAAQDVGGLVLTANRQEHAKQEHPKNEKSAMKLNRTFAGPAEMPATIPLFPMAGALLLPRRPIQLTVFEPRYLEMLDDALAGERLIGVIQPSSEKKAPDPAPDFTHSGAAGGT